MPPEYVSLGEPVLLVCKGAFLLEGFGRGRGRKKETDRDTEKRGEAKQTFGEEEGEASKG